MQKKEILIGIKFKIEMEYNINWTQLWHFLRQIKLPDQLTCMSLYTYSEPLLNDFDPTIEMCKCLLCQLEQTIAQKWAREWYQLVLSMVLNTREIWQKRKWMNVIIKIDWASAINLSHIVYYRLLPKPLLWSHKSNSSFSDVTGMRVLLACDKKQYIYLIQFTIVF